MSRKAVKASKRPRRLFTEEFKRAVVSLLLDGHSAMSVAERLGLSNPNLLYRWKSSQLESSGPVAASLEARVYDTIEARSSDEKSLDGDDDEQPAAEVNELSLLSLQYRWLNYGYAVLRAMTARAVCAPGLHPSLGLHHHNRYNAFCLADDLMEPFRPAVDLAVVRLFEHHADLWELNREAKRELLSALTERCLLGGEQRTLFDTLTRTASSLASVLMDETEVLDLPVETKRDRKRYSQFRQKLLSEGFSMLQFSVYARYCSGEDMSNSLRDRVRKVIPQEGQVRLMGITDRQFGKMEEQNPPGT